MCVLARQALLHYMDLLPCLAVPINTLPDQLCGGKLMTVLKWLSMTMLMTVLMTAHIVEHGKVESWRAIEEMCIILFVFLWFH